MDQQNVKDKCQKFLLSFLQSNTKTHRGAFKRRHSVSVELSREERVTRLLGDEGLKGGGDTFCEGDRSRGAGGRGLLLWKGLS